MWLAVFNNSVYYNDTYIDNFFRVAIEYGWHINKQTQPLQLAENVKARYSRLPDDYQLFLQQIGLCTNREDTVWFLTGDHYSSQPPSAFAWNEFEVMSLDSAKGYDDLTKSIEAFWETHMPIAFSLTSGYAYLAIDLTESNFGEIVHGREPEFEDASRICSTFSELLDLLVDNFRNPVDVNLSDFA